MEDLQETTGLKTLLIFIILFNAPIYIGFLGGWYFSMQISTMLMRYGTPSFIAQFVSRIILVSFFTLSGVSIVIILMLMDSYAKKSLAGKQFIAGTLYQIDGRGKSIILPLGNVSEIGKVEFGGLLWYINAVWKKEKLKKKVGFLKREEEEVDILDYLVVSPRPLTEALCSRSTKKVMYKGLIELEVNVFYVALLELPSRVIDAMKQLVEQDIEVKVYFMTLSPKEIVDFYMKQISNLAGGLFNA